MKTVSAVLAVILGFSSAFATAPAPAAGTTPPAQKQPAVKVDHSSQEGLLLSYFQALVNGDGEAMWEILAPAYRKTLAQNDEAAAKKTFIEAIRNLSASAITEQLRNLLKTEEGRKSLVSETMSVQKDIFLQVDGKWYLDVGKARFSALPAIDSVAGTVPLKSPGKIDHSSKMALFKSFYLALMANDIETALQAVEAKSLEEMIRKDGRENIVKQLRETIGAIPEEMRQQVSSLLLDPQYEPILQQTLLSPFEKIMIQVDGKWYLNFKQTP